jgi:hypothetical protein
MKIGFYKLGELLRYRSAQGFVDELASILILVTPFKRLNMPYLSKLAYV